MAAQGNSEKPCYAASDRGDVTPITTDFLSPYFLSTLQLYTAELATPSGIIVAALLFVRFRHHRWDGNPMTFAIDGNKGQVRRTHVLAVVVNVVFHPYFHSNLHRTVKDTVY